MKPKTNLTMKLKAIFKSKILKRSAEKVVDRTADILAQKPEVASLSETLVKRFTTYAHIGDKILHFHLVVFGLMLGFSLMTGIIAVGKLAGYVGIALFENNDLVFILGYFAFFSGILYGFFKHYASAHHERLHEQKLKDLTDTFSMKEKELQKEFDEKKESLEDEFIARSKSLAQKIKEQEQEVNYLKEQAAQIRKETEEMKKDNSVWDTISSYNPVKRSKS